MRIVSGLQFLILALVIAVGSGALYKLYDNQTIIASAVDYLADEYKMLREAQINEPPASAPQVDGVENDTIVSGAGKGFAWSDLKPTFSNTVVQIFSQVAEYNWLQPWRAPAGAQCSGSGFFINDEGYIVTNAHVINEARMVMVRIPSMGKRQYEAEIVGLTTDRDLALLKLKPKAFEAIKAAIGEIPYLQFSDSDQAHRADEVMALGFPLGQLSLKSTTGVVSGWEHISGNHLIQMAAAINPGSSGGPVLNKDGKIVGVSVAGIASAQNIAYIIPSNDVIAFIDQIKKLPSQEGKPKVLHRPFLGVSFCNGTDTLTSYLGNPHPGGLVVVDIFDDGPLGAAGIAPGDMIYSINGNRIDLYGEVMVPGTEEEKISVIDYAGRLTIGDIVDLTVYRNGKKTEYSVKMTAPDPDVWPLRKARLPNIDFDVNDYEIVGGLCIAPLTRNNLSLLVQVAPLLAKFVDPSYQREQALIVTDIVQGSSAFRDRIVGPGVIIDKINDVEVNTLEDLRGAIKKGAKTGYLKIETQEKFLMVFSLPEVVKEASRLAKENKYKLSPFIRELQQLVPVK